MAQTPSTDLDLTPRARLDEGGMHDLLGYLVAQAGIVTFRQFANHVGQPLGLRPVEFTILQLVNKNPGVSPTRLARALDLSTPAMTVWLDKLARRGLLRRERNATDGRAQQVQLTADGQSLVTQALDVLLRTQEQMVAHLSAAERAMLVELLRKLGHAKTA